MNINEGQTKIRQFPLTYAPVMTHGWKVETTEAVGLRSLLSLEKAK